MTELRLIPSRRTSEPDFLSTIVAFCFWERNWATHNKKIHIKQKYSYIWKLKIFTSCSKWCVLFFLLFGIHSNRHYEQVQINLQVIFNAMFCNACFYELCITNNIFIIISIYVICIYISKKEIQTIQRSKE